MLAPLLALALLQAPQTPPTAATTGDFLYSACKVYVELADSQPLTGKPFSGGYCMGLIVGLSDALIVDKVICPGQAKIETIARVYLAYMDRSPKLRDELAEVGMISAMKEAYPCPVK